MTSISRPDSKPDPVGSIISGFTNLKGLSRTLSAKSPRDPLERLHQATRDFYGRIVALDDFITTETNGQPKTHKEHRFYTNLCQADVPSLRRCLQPVLDRTFPTQKLNFEAIRNKISFLEDTVLARTSYLDHSGRLLIEACRNGDKPSIQALIDKGTTLSCLQHNHVKPHDLDLLLQAGISIGCPRDHEIILDGISLGNLTFCNMRHRQDLALVLFLYGFDSRVIRSSIPRNIRDQIASFSELFDGNPFQHVLPALEPHLDQTAGTNIVKIVCDHMGRPTPFIDYLENPELGIAHRDFCMDLIMKKSVFPKVPKHEDKENQRKALLDFLYKEHQNDERKRHEEWESRRHELYSKQYGPWKGF